MDFTDLSLNDCCLYCQGPEELLELYNAVIQHLCDTVTSESLLNLSWPVAEFTRHDESSKF